MSTIVRGISRRRLAAVTISCAALVAAAIGPVFATGTPATVNSTSTVLAGLIEGTTSGDGADERDEPESQIDEGEVDQVETPGTEESEAPEPSDAAEPSEAPHAKPKPQATSATVTEIEDDQGEDNDDQGDDDQGD